MSWEHLTYIGVVLVVEEAPENSHEEIEDRYSSIKRQLGDLGTRKLAISIAELSDGRILARSELVREDTVIASIFDVVLDRLRVLQVDGLGEDQVLGFLSRVWREDELSNILLFAESGLDVLLLADSSFLCIALDCFLL